MGSARKNFNYLESVTDERLETLLGCHERALSFFGEVPSEVLYDNMRTVVTDGIASDRACIAIDAGSSPDCRAAMRASFLSACR
jgi:hypothetical protein